MTTDENDFKKIFVKLPRKLEMLRQFLHYVGRAEIILAILALVFVVALSAVQTISRYAFGVSMWWSQEVTEVAILFSYFFGISYVFKTRQYILIEFLSSMGTLRLQLVLYFFAQVLTVMFAGLITWMFFLFLPTLVNMRTTVLGWPGWITALPLVAASLMMVLTSLYYGCFAIWAFCRDWGDATFDAVEHVGLTNLPVAEIG